VVRRGDVSPRLQLQIGRVAGAAVAAVAVVIALLAKDKNVAILSNVAFAIAASSTTPVLLLTLYWRRFNRGGATAALVGGLIVSCGLTILGPDVTGVWSPFGLAIPALVSVPAALLLAVAGTFARRHAGEPGDTTPYEEIRARAFAPIEPASS
jgi:SSS family solute:Na+ symporter/cation/acetate symporter